MRLSILTLVFLSSVVWADDARERRVRVALALAASAQCGECRFDEKGCREEALKAGEPLVLFVGPACGQCGKIANAAGAVSCVVESYSHDEYPATATRIVILEPKPGGGFWRIDTLIQPTESALKTALDKLKAPNSPAPTVIPLNWSF